MMTEVGTLGLVVGFIPLTSGALISTRPVWGGMGGWGVGGGGGG